MAWQSDNSVELQTLLDLARYGDKRAYDDVISKAYDRLLRLTRKMLWNYPQLRRYEQTDDIFQTAAMKLYRSLKDVQPTNVRAFWGLAALQIRRTLIDLARHHFGPQGHGAHHHSEVRSRADDGVMANAADERSSEPQSLEAWARFHEAVEALPAQEREVFDLLWYGEMTQKAVAEVLDVSERTVLRRVQSARVRLSEALRR